MGPISGSHQGPQPQRLHREAGYMAAPVSFREKVRVFPLQSGRRPYMCHATLFPYTALFRSQRITSGPAATTAASRGRIHGCTRIRSQEHQSQLHAQRAPAIRVPREERTRGSEWDRSADHIRARSHNGCIERPDTWLHPYRFAKRSESFPCKAGAVHTCATRHYFPTRRSSDLSGSHQGPQPQRLHREAGYMAAPVSDRKNTRVNSMHRERPQYVCHARKERAEVNGTDQRITSGPAATTAASRGRIHGCTRIVSRKGQSLSLAKRAPSIHVPRDTISLHGALPISADHIRARSHNGCIERPDTWLHPYQIARTPESTPCTESARNTCATRGKNARK